MSMFQFNAAEVEPQESLEPVPAGDYVVIIEDSDLKDTARMDGQYLELVLKIMDGPFKGRMIWARLNVVNKNETAQRIAQGQLSAICHALGVLQLTATEQLHGKPLMAKVTYVPAKGEYTAKNDVKGFRKLNGQPPGQPSQQAANAPQHQAAPAHQPAPAAQAPIWNR